MFNQKITKPARRIYVGNLPVGPAYTEEFFLNYFVKQTKKVSDHKYKGLISFWIAPQKNYGFCEFASVRDAHRAGFELNGLLIGGRMLRCGRPTDYEPVPEYLENYYVGGPNPRIPHDFDIAKYMHMFGVQNQQDPKVEKRPVKIKEMPIPGRGSLRAQIKNMRSKKRPKRSRDSDCSRALRIEGMIRSTELSSTSTFKEVLQNIRSVVSQYGEIEALLVPRKGELASDSGVGKVYVLYEDIDDAEAAMKKIEKKLFDGRSLTVEFFEESSFKSIDLY